MERGVHAGAGLLAGLVIPVGDPPWSSLFLKDFHSMEGTHTGAVREELQPVGRTYFGSVHGQQSPMGGTHTGAGAECE